MKTNTLAHSKPLLATFTTLVKFSVLFQIVIFYLAITLKKNFFKTLSYFEVNKEDLLLFVTNFCKIYTFFFSCIFGFSRHILW